MTLPQIAALVRPAPRTRSAVKRWMRESLGAIGARHWCREGPTPDYVLCTAP